MSTTIDQRVVEMQFDNRHFENNVATTITSLGKLKQSLNLHGATKGLEEIDRASKKVDMSALASAVDTIQSKFSALNIIGTTALANITNSAVNAGKKITSALTIDPVKSGLSEYETQINAVQTILANTESKGTTLEDVNGALDTLNKYADKTIYNFTEMTRNIGTFTAAGVDLDTSVNAIQGIANLAAVSGSSSQQASTAMYQLSQALASGTVKLMDWNSVVNAGMGGQVFQDALKETARVHGIAIDDMIKENGSFRETLHEGWLTSEILTETLSKFTMSTEDMTEAEIKANKEKFRSLGYTEEQIEGIFKLGKTATDAATKVKTFTQLWDTLKETAQSGWTQTWELIFGDFEGAKSFFSDLYNRLAPILEATAAVRNELLTGWNKAGGRDDLIASLNNIFDAIGSVVKPIKEAFTDIFPPMTVKQLVDMTRMLKEFTAGLKLSGSTSDKLKRTFKGFFAIFDIAKQALSAVLGAIKPLFGGIGILGGGILDVTAKIGDWLVQLNETNKKSGTFSKALQGIANAVKYIAGAIILAFKKMQEVLSSLGVSIIGASRDVASELGAIGANLKRSSFLSTLQTLWKGFSAIVLGIVKGVIDVGGALANVLVNLDFTSIMELIKDVIAGGVGIAIISFISNLKDAFGGIGEIIEATSGTLEILRKTLQAYQTSIRADALIKIAGAIAILVASILVLSLVDSDKLYDAIVAIAALFGMLMLSMMGAMRSMGKFSGVFKLGMVTTSMIKIAASVFILALALEKIGNLGFENIIAGVIGIAGLAAVMVVSVTALNDAGNKAIKGAMQMVIFAAAIKILASACSDLAYLELDELARGLLGVAALMASVVIFTRTAKFDGKILSTAIGVIAIAAAIKIMASACSDFGSMDWDGIKKSLISIGVLLAELVIFTRLAGNTKGIVGIGLGLIAIGAAMKIFASAAMDIAKLSWNDLAKGLVGMAVALTALVITLRLMPKNLIASGLGLIAISTAIVILADALGQMGGMSGEAVAKSLIALGGSMLILAIGLKAMNGSIAGSAALIVAAVALNMLAPVLVNLGSLDTPAIAKALIALAGAFVIIGVAGYLLQPLVPTILGLAGALALIGASVALVGAGLFFAGIGLTSFATGLTALVGSVAIGTSAIVGVVSAVISGLIKGVADGIVMLCDIIVKGIPAIGKAIKVVVLELCDVLVECTPEIVRTVLIVLAEVFEGLAEFTPRIVTAITDFIIGILDSLGRNISRIVVALVDFFKAVFAGVIDALGGIDFSSMVSAAGCVGIMTGVMLAMSSLAALAPSAMIGVLAFGVLIAELAIVLAAVGALAQIPGLTWLVEKGGDLLEGVGRAIGRFVGGIVGGVAQGFTSSLPQIGTDLSTFMQNIQPFIDGARGIDESVVSGVMSLVKAMLAITGAGFLETIASMLDGGLLFGDSSAEKFASDLAALGKGLAGFSDAVGEVNPEQIRAAANAAKTLAEMTNIVPNEGGIVAWFTGENSISKFGDELPALGKGLKGFADSVDGINPDGIRAAAEAAKALVDLTANIPNEGGIVAWFTGDNSLSKFSDNIVSLGDGLKGFSDAIDGVSPDNLKAAAEAAKALALMTTYIPNEGGMVAWFTGENSITRFADNIVDLGKGLAGFAKETADIVPDNLKAAAEAAKTLAQMTTYIPNEGGMVAWFTGENSITRFADNIVNLGKGLKGFAQAVTDIVPDNVKAAAEAAKSLAEMTTYIPNEGGMVAWFTGDNSISTFASQLPTLGRGLKGFSESMDGVVPDTIKAAADSAKALAEMTTYIPNEGGMKAWFTGESGLANFAGQLPKLGIGLKGFAVSIEGINPENISAAAGAAKALAEMTAVIPTEGGIKAWFTGETSIANFASKLPELGKGLKGFSDAVAGINGENVNAAANAAKTLGQMTETIPKNTDKIATFGTNLVTFGGKLASYFSKTSGITAEAISATDNAIKSVEKVSKLESGNIKSISGAIDDISKSLKNLSKIPKDCTSEFSNAMKKLGSASADKLVEALESIEDDTEKAGKSAMKAFVAGVEGMTEDAKNACVDVAEACADAISGKKGLFKTAGRDLVDGFISGITSNTFKASAKAKAMAEAAAQAAKDALDINSPSKVFRAIGESVPEGFAAGIDKFSGLVAQSSTAMTDTALGTVNKSISHLADLVSTEVDTQPTIRPVLDLTDIQEGAKSLNSLFGSNSVGVLANVGAINSAMNGQIQNGGNDDVVSAIRDLRKDFENFKRDSYQFGDIIIGGDDEVASAVQTLVRAVKIGKRV